MTTKIKQATPTDTDMFIFGGGIPAHWSWWKYFDRNFDYVGPDSWLAVAPDHWTYTVGYESLEDEDVTLEKVINHKVILSAARKIVAEKKLNDRIVKECSNLLFNVDEADLDAIDADAVLQVAVYGEVVFG